MSKTPQQYCNDVLGKAFDIDGQYGCQCVDGFKHFVTTQCGYDISHMTICDPSGYATSIWDNFYKLGLDKYFDQVPWDNMLDGDWAIWDLGSRSCPYSHVAMFRRDNDCGRGIFLGQNQLGHPEFTQISIYYDGLRGGLRPKIYHEEQPTTPPSGNPIYVTDGEMNVRVEPYLKARHVLVRDLTEDGKKNATSDNPNAWAVYRKGTRFTVYGTSTEADGRVWGRSPSGWITLIGSTGKVYCHKD